MAHCEPAFPPFCPVAIKLRAKTLWRAPTIPGRSSILVTKMAPSQIIQRRFWNSSMYAFTLWIVRYPIDLHIWWLRDCFEMYLWITQWSAPSTTVHCKALIRPWHWNCIISCTIAAVCGTQQRLRMMIESQALTYHIHSDVIPLSSDTCATNRVCDLQ